MPSNFLKLSGNLNPEGTRVFRTLLVKHGSPHISSSSSSRECRCSLLFCRALSTRACVAVSLAPLVLSGPGAAAVGRGLFCLADPSGGEFINAVPMAPTPAMAILYSASLGSPGGGLDARMNACVAMYPASGVLGLSLIHI